MLRIDESSPIPIYLQIFEELKLMILGKTYEADERLPSIRQIATDLKVNPNTVAKAFQELESHGLIYFKRGQGAYAAEIAGQDKSAEIAIEITKRLDELLNFCVQMGLTKQKICDLFMESLEKQIPNEEGGK